MSQGGSIATSARSEMGAYRKDRLTNSRRLAYDALDKMRSDRIFANAAIEEIIDSSSIDKRDKNFAATLVLGVTTHRGTLDAVLDKCLNSPKDVKEDVRMALRISAFELLYLDKTRHAAVDQGVELVHYVAPAATGLANSVLRKVAKAADSFPYGDPDEDLRSFALQQGFPGWLAARLTSQMGEENARALMRCSNEPAPIYFHALCSKDDLQALDIRCKSVDEVGDVSLDGCYKLNTRDFLGSNKMQQAIANGLVVIADASAQAVASIVSECVLRKAKDGEGSASLLEIGAGRGTKTALIESHIRKPEQPCSCKHVALDSDQARLDALGQRMELLEMKVDDVILADAAEDLPEGLGAFDVVFVDAPCSGLGTLRRHPDIRWRLSERSLERQVSLQARMLEQASKHVSVGGYLIYSTCSEDLDENQGQVIRFLKSEFGKGFRALKVTSDGEFQTHASTDGPDGHFAIVLQRAGESDGL